MAEEDDNSQEKTEEATPRRLEKAREEGQTARSKELATMAVLLAGAGGMLVFGASLGASLEAIMRESFVIERSAIFDMRHMSVQLIESSKEAAWALSPILVLLLIAAIFGSIGLFFYDLSTHGWRRVRQRFLPAAVTGYGSNAKSEAEAERIRQKRGLMPYALPVALSTWAVLAWHVIRVQS